MKLAMSFLRTAQRPFVVILVTILFCVVILFQIPVPERAWTIIETVVLFLFIGRTVQTATRKED